MGAYKDVMTTAFCLGLAVGRAAVAIAPGSLDLTRHLPTVTTTARGPRGAEVHAVVALPGLPVLHLRDVIPCVVAAGDLASEVVGGWFEVVAQ